MNKILLSLVLVPSLSFAASYKISFKNEILTQAASQKPPFYLNCEDALNQGNNTNGLYNIKVSNSKTIKLYCDMTSNGGGWTLVMRGVGGKNSGWGTANELNISNANSTNVNTGGTFKLSDSEINYIRGSSGIYRLKSNGTFNLTRVKSFSYNHMLRTYQNSAFPIPSTTYSSITWQGAFSASSGEAQTYPYYGISDDHLNYNAYFTTNYNNSFWVDGADAGILCNRTQINCNMTMWFQQLAKNLLKPSHFVIF